MQTSWEEEDLKVLDLKDFPAKGRGKDDERSAPVDERIAVHRKVQSRAGSSALAGSEDHFCGEWNHFGQKT